MYWRRGVGFYLLWIASLTLAMCGLAAWAFPGSTGAALSFLAVAAVFAPPVQEQIARLRHSRAPPRVAFFAVITLLPIGLGILVIDWVDALENDARKRGFASAAQWGRAKDLGLSSRQALVEHDQARRRSEVEAACRKHSGQPPLECFEPAHGKAALAFAKTQLGNDKAVAAVRDAIANQRSAFLAADKQCAALLDRVDAQAVPAILADMEGVQSLAAGIWARHLSQTELEVLLSRSQAGVTRASTRNDGQDLDQRLATVAAAVGRDFDAAVQARAIDIALSEPAWRMFLQGFGPPAPCKAAQTARS